MDHNLFFRCFTLLNIQVQYLIPSPGLDFHQDASLGSFDFYCICLVMQYQMENMSFPICFPYIIHGERITHCLLVFLVSLCCYLSSIDFYNHKR